MSDPIDALIRIEDYLARRNVGSGYDRDLIHSFDVSPDGGVILSAADIRAVLGCVGASVVNAARRRRHERTANKPRLVQTSAKQDTAE